MALFAGAFVAVAQEADDDEVVIETALDLINESIRQNGGQQALESIRTIVVSGTISPADADPFNFTIYRKRPNKMRVNLDFGSYEIETYYDGKGGTRVVSAPSGEVQAEVLSGEELERLENDSSIEGPAFHLLPIAHKLPDPVLDEVRGEPAYRIDLDPELEGVKFDAIWLSAENFQELKLQRTIESGEDGKESVEEIFFSDFDQIKGVYYAGSLENAVDGKFTQSMTVNRIRPNVGVYDKVFEYAE